MPQAKKKVRVTIEMDSEFVGLLKTNISLSKMGENGQPSAYLDVAGVLAVVVASEAMGNLPENTWRLIPPIWRPHIDVVPEERKILVEGEWSPTATKAKEKT